jgi:hypothetical protein
MNKIFHQKEPLGKKRDSKKEKEISKAESFLPFCVMGSTFKSRQ